jgi:hypothetical protein
VRVHRSDGAPVVGAIVSVARSTTPVPELALLSNKDGLVMFQLSTGRYAVEAFTEDGGKGSIELEVENSEPTIVEILIERGRT